VLQPPGDLQGALILLPTFQLAFLAALWMATRARLTARFFGAVCVLLVLQVLTLAAIGEFEAGAGASIHPLVIRAWAIAVPLLLVWLGTGGRRRPVDRPGAYLGFWNDVGRAFPSLTGAPSTRFYFANEVRLLTAQVPELSRCRLLKTDLWDEVKNTRILQWAAGQGAQVYGIDISSSIVRQARGAFDGRPVGVAQADVRLVPFADASFDAVYSMGTIEHFPESAQAVKEFARVLRPGGRLILGVPNLHDPFLRPMLVWLLQRLKLYGYGAERAFSRRQLRTMIEAAGLRVEAETGILFLPGWLRMLDLWCYTRTPSLTWLIKPWIAAFESLDRRFPALCRHGYLIASVGIKPDASSPSRPITRSADGP
jgi:SAM-dependent methyltransferase